MRRFHFSNESSGAVGRDAFARGATTLGGITENSSIDRNAPEKAAIARSAHAHKGSSAASYDLAKGIVFSVRLDRDQAWCPALAITSSRTRLWPGGGRTNPRTLVHGLPSGSESTSLRQSSDRTKDIPQPFGAKQMSTELGRA